MSLWATNSPVGTKFEFRTIRVRCTLAIGRIEAPWATTISAARIKSAWPTPTRAQRSAGHVCRCGDEHGRCHPSGPCQVDPPRVLRSHPDVPPCQASPKAMSRPGRRCRPIGYCRNYRRANRGVDRADQTVRAVPLVAASRLRQSRSWGKTPSGTRNLDCKWIDPRAVCGRTRFRPVRSRRSWTP